MTALCITFWLLIALILYTYFGYALVMMLVTRKKNSPAPGNDLLPGVTLVVACYNEGKVLPEKIRNTEAIDYPRDKLSVIFITDGSTDNSLEILAGHPFIRTLHQDERAGKAHAINRAMQAVSTEIVVFTDANTFLNADCLKKIMPHFNDPGTGGVAGEKKLLHASGMGEAEGWYWKYESFLKTLDARFYSVVGAAGELFAIRRSLFTPLPVDTLLDDFALSLHICLGGKIIGYEPKAFAVEKPSQSLTAEKHRKIRIAAGAFQTLSRLSFQKLFAYPRFAFQFLSRRWLRWVFCPIAIVLVFILNAWLAWYGGELYRGLFILQLLFYMLAGMGWMLIRKNRSAMLTTIPFYFLFMNYCMMAGLLKHLSGKETVLWKKADR